MLTVRELTSIPSYFITNKNTKRNYIHSYNILHWSIFILSYHKMGNLNIIDFKIHSESDPYGIYYVSIGTPDIVLKKSSPVKVYCTCPDFMYTFGYVLYKHDSLLYAEEFPKEVRIIPPRKRNPHGIPFVCKHVYTILNYCLEKQIKFSEDEVLKYNKINKIIRPIFDQVYKFYLMIERMRNKHKRK